MNPADIILGLVSVVCTGLGWWMKDIWEAHRQLRQELSEFKEAVPQRYVAKDDFKEDMREIKETLQRIYSKLDSKADK